MFNTQKQHIILDSNKLYQHIITILYLKCFLDCPCIGEKPVFLPDDDGVNRSRSIIPIATNGDIFPWNNVRLPTFARPYSYHIKIHPNLTSLDVKGMNDMI